MNEFEGKESMFGTPPVDSLDKRRTIQFFSPKKEKRKLEAWEKVSRNGRQDRCSYRRNKTVGAEGSIWLKFESSGSNLMDWRERHNEKTAVFSPCMRPFCRVNILNLF